jgi:hypothetical protein
MAQKYQRKRLWVDGFQTRLLLRMGGYLLACLVIVWHIGFGFEVLRRLGTNGFDKGLGAMYLDYLSAQTPLLYAFLVIVPAYLYDLLRFSNRIAGPLYRCRKVMDEMAAGKPVAEFTPRKGDFMGELFRSFNGLILAWNARVTAGANGTGGAATPTSEPLVETPPGPVGRLSA